MVTEDVDDEGLVQHSSATRLSYRLDVLSTSLSLSLSLSLSHLRAPRSLLKRCKDQGGKSSPCKMDVITGGGKALRQFSERGNLGPFRCTVVLTVTV